ncbi:MAG: trehalose 6-phosphate synthase, partial [Omnitrophica bacterium]|nr:trehalose 6-phosphate synthase [Candidatus Omnitrophota bacterium]
FLDKDIGLKIENGPILICGDTKSDIPMISAAMKKTKDTWSIFVTTDSRLKGKVTQTCPNSLFVSTPDILVAILNNLGKN